MSRKGKMPIAIPKGVEVNISGKEISVKGPKGTLSLTVKPEIEMVSEDGQVRVSLSQGAGRDRNKFHGLYWQLISNMVQGTSEGFSKELTLIGVGYRAAVQGNVLDLQLGYSHPTKLDIPAGIEVKVEKGTVVTVSGADKQAVGQFAAEIRAMRPPEPYKGKGARYTNEYVRRKAGKAAKR